MLFRSLEIFFNSVIAMKPIKSSQALFVLSFSLLMPGAPAHAQFGDLLKNVRQIGQVANGLGGFSSELQAFIDGIKSISDVTISPQGNPSPPSPQSPQSQAEQVILYTTPTCPYCKLAMKHVRDNQIPYLEKDVRANPVYAAEFKRIGGGGVPYILMGAASMRGFNAASFDKQYAAWKASAVPSQPAVSTPSLATPTAAGG